MHFTFDQTSLHQIFQNNIVVNLFIIYDDLNVKTFNMFSTIPQFASSSPSLQSFVPSHVQEFLIHLLLLHSNWLVLHPVRE